MCSITDQNKNKQFSLETHILKKITGCISVFQRNNYVDLACFLNICKQIMVFLCFSRVKVTYSTFNMSYHFDYIPTNRFRLHFKENQIFEPHCMLNGFMTLNCIIEALQKSIVVCKLNGIILFTQSLSEIYSVLYGVYFTLNTFYLFIYYSQVR